MPTNLPPAIYALLSAGASRFTVPMEPQPRQEVSGFMDLGPCGSDGFWRPLWDADYCPYEWDNHALQPPYPPGTVLPVREEWAIHYCAPLCSRGVVYKADYPRGIEDTHDFGLFKWNTAKSMPPGIVRRHVVVTDCQPVRVEDVKDIYAIRDLGLDVGGLVAGFEIETYEDEYDDPGAFCGAAIDLFREWYARHFPGTTLESWAWMVSVEPKGEPNEQ